MILGIDLLKNILILGKVIAGKIVSMKEYAKMIILVSLEETFVLRTFIDGKNNE